VPDYATTPVQSILLCGASVRSLAESCMSVGLRPLCVDFFADHDLKRSLQKGRGRFVTRLNSFEEIPQAIRPIRRNVPVVWTGGLENYPDVLRTLAGDRPVIGASVDAVEAVRNPLNLANWVSRSDMQVPPMVFGSIPELNTRWLQKSISSSGGLGVHWMARGSPTQRNHCGSGNSGFSGSVIPTQAGIQCRDLDFRPRVCGNDELPESQVLTSHYLQEFIDGVPLSATFVSGPDGVRHIGTSLQLVGWPSLGASDFLFCGNLGPIRPPAWMSQQLLAAATSIVKQSGLRGVFGLDFILKERVLWLLEVNPRLTASHVIYDQTSADRLRKPLIVEHLNAFGYSPVRSLSPDPISESRKALAAGELPRKPAASTLPLTKDATQKSSDIERAMLRMILWATEDFRASHFHASSDMALFVGLRPGAVHTADLPAPDSTITQRSPLCSVELQAAELCAIPDALIAALDRPCTQPKYGWDLVVAAIRDLLWQYETHLTAIPGRFES
jgi:predicted ATP-grasp superfamily ATP-dependent carboligase